MANSENFKVSAALKDLIGKELITDEFVAVFELVKNSFDANAKKVEVIFENNYEQQNSRIIIKDNGKGMNYNDLKNKWLFVAYSAKKTGKENDDYRDKIKTQRVFAGAKGVGRFSCDRLGKHLNLITIKDEPNFKIENFIVNWEDFENADEQEFINIKVAHNELNNISYDLKHGTVLEISGLRDYWDRERILKLKKSLAKLINPNQGNDSDKFEIEIIAKDEASIDQEKKNELDTINGLVKNHIFETLGIKTSNILVQISPDGDFIETTLQDRGDIIYYLKEKNQYPDLKNISVYLFQLNRSAKGNFTRAMGMEPVKYGSVFMYKNGFRVYPYGEPGEDLLLIDNRKQQGYNRHLGTRDLIGRIEINGEQPKLKETTSRDGGLVKTPTYYNMVEFFYNYVLKRLENYVVNIIDWGDPEIDKITKEVVHPELWAKDVKVQILELISGFINSKNIIDIQYDKDFLEIISEKQEKSVEKIVKNIAKVAAKSGNPEMIKEAKKIEKAIKDVRADAEIATAKATKEEALRKKTEKKLEAVVSQKNFLQSEISDNTKNLESILHHIGLTTNLIKTDIENLAKSINKGSKEELIDIAKRLSRQNEKITSFSKYFKKVNFNIHSNKLETDIISFTNEYLQNVYLLRDDLRKNRELLNISIDTPNSIEYKIKFNPIDLIIVLDNLISNSSKHEATRVELTWKKSDETIQLFFKDNGMGIDDNIVQNIFDFGFTTSRRGSGIGLYHVKEIIERLNGSITVNNKLNKGVEFIITL